MLSSIEDLSYKSKYSEYFLWIASLRCFQMPGHVFSPEQTYYGILTFTVL